MNSQEIKSEYPQPSNTCYLNTASSGLVSRQSIEKANEFNQKLFHLGSKQAEDFYIQEIPAIRKTLSKFIDASLEEIAFIPNFSFGLNAVLPSIQQLNKVLLYEGDYPSLTLPFELNDFEIFWIKSKDKFTIDLDEIESMIKEYNIEVVAISHVQYLSGFKIDLEKLSAICKKQNALLILDGTQSLGAIPFSFKTSGVNILITSNYKWINGGYGAGFMCMDMETLNRFPPKIGGFNSYKYHEKKCQYKVSINSYEPGHPNMAALALLKEAIDFKLHLGLENIAAHNLKLVDYFISKISSLSYEIVGQNNPKNRAGIVGIYGSQQLEKFLINHNVIIKRREGIIRIGFHFYNTLQDIDRLVNTLSEYRGK